MHSQKICNMGYLLQWRISVSIADSIEDNCLCVSYRNARLI